tara:strand:- start:3037 stop:3444 length:408 start_codon:yes stop_codon:yes gene_type:complete
MNKIKVNDLKFGKLGEIKSAQILQEKFGELFHTEDQYNHFDYYNDKIFLEVKTRNIKGNQYDSLMFELHKIESGLKHMENGFEVWFAWNCKDGIYLWKLNQKEYFSKFSGRTDRGCDERRILAHIKNEYITKYEN